MVNTHYMEAERLLGDVIRKMDSAMYQSSYETELCNKLKRAHNEMQRAANAEPFYPEVE